MDDVRRTSQLALGTRSFGWSGEMTVQATVTIQMVTEHSWNRMWTCTWRHTVRALSDQSELYDCDTLDDCEGVVTGKGVNIYDESQSLLGDFSWD